MNVFGVAEGSIGEVVSKPNMFVTNVYFGKNLSGQSLEKRIDNTYLTSVKDPVEKMVDGKSEWFIAKEINLGSEFVEKAKSDLERLGQNTEKLIRDGYRISRADFQNNPVFRVEHPDGKISSMPDRGEHLEEVFAKVSGDTSGEDDNLLKKEPEPLEGEPLTSEMHPLDLWVEFINERGKTKFKRLFEFANNDKMYRFFSVVKPISVVTGTDEAKHTFAVITSTPDTINDLFKGIVFSEDAEIDPMPEPAEEPAIVVPESFTGTFYQGTEHKYKNPYEVNKAIEELIDHKEATKGLFTYEEKVFISRHSGSGGLEKFGASGISIMYEYFTPDPIVKKMWGLAYKYGFNDTQNVCEPAAGVGRFITYAPDKSKVSALDINPYLVKICKILYPETSIKEMHFERLFLKDNASIKGKISGMQQYGLVIGNPPYGKIDGGKWMSMGEDSYTKAGNYAEYFITRGLDLLVSGGLLIYIIGAELRNGGRLFLSSPITPAKAAIMEKADLIDAYRLPSDIFERTGVTTEIIVLRKK